MAVIYEVNLTVEQAIEDEFAHWLIRHVDEMVALPGFMTADVAREERGPNQPVAFSVRYRLQSRVALDRYFAEHADRMRADGLNRFGQQFSASRRILFPLQR